MTRLIFTLSTFLLILSIPSLSFAKGSVGGSVKVGDTIPHNLELKDQLGKMHSFSDLKGKKGMVLVFVRSVEWCPFCQKQIIGLSKEAKKFSDAGYPVVSVSYDALPQIEKFVTKNNPKITLLSDPASESIRAFGILNEASAKGTMSYGIPHPGVYIVDKNKKVQAKFFKKNVKDRPSTTEILAKIKSLNAPVIPPMTIESMGQDPVSPEDQFIVTPEKQAPIILPEDVPASVAPETVLDVVPKVTPEMVSEKTPDVAPIEAPEMPVAPAVELTPNEMVPEKNIEEHVEKVIEDKVIETLPPLEDTSVAPSVM